MPYNATLVGSPTFTTGKFGQAVSLNGSSQYVQLPAGGPYEEATGTTWAVSCWIKTSDASAGFHEIVSQGGGTGNWIISINSGKIRAGVYNLTGPLSFNEFGDTVTVSDNAWHYVALYVTPTAATLYVDGSSAGASTGASYIIPGATRSTRIGAEWSSSNYYNGLIDEVAFWSTGVTSSVGTSVPSGALVGNETGLVALYHLDGDATDGISVPGQTLAVNNAALHFSPGNWWGDTGRGGSVARYTWANGAYVTFTWSAASSTTRCNVLISQPSTGTATMAIYLDGTYTDNFAIPTYIGGVYLPNLSGSGTHTCTIYIDSPSSSTARWSQNAAIVFAGIEIENADTPGTATVPTKWGIIWGDSTAEGTDSGVSGASTITCSWAQMLSIALQTQGYDVCLSPCGGNGYLAPGDLSPFDVPGLYWVSGSSGGTGGTYDDTKSRWNKIVGGPTGSNSVGYVSILDSNNHLSSYGSTSTEPSFVVSLMGLNEYFKNEGISDTQASVNQWVSAVRGAAPNAHIYVVIPPGFYNTTVYPTQGSAPNKTGPDYVTAIKAGANAYTAAHPTDYAVHLVDFGSAVSNTIASTYYNSVDGAKVHFSLAGHQYAASLVIPAVVNPLSGGISGLTAGDVSSIASGVWTAPTRTLTG